MAGRHGRVIEPMLCLTVDFYIRLFIRVRDSPINCHRNILKYSSVYQCVDCEAHYFQAQGRELVEVHEKAENGKVKKYKHQGKPNENNEESEKEEEKGDNKVVHKVCVPRVTVPAQCTVCDGPLTIGGPIWNQPLHDVDFVKRLMKTVREQKEVTLGTKQRIQAILTGIIDEKAVEDVPLNYDINYICSSLRMQNPNKKEFIYAMNQIGYKAVQTYYNSKLWKTNAPPDVLYDVFKVHKYMQFKNDQTKIFANLSEKSAGYRIFQKPLLNKDLKFDFKNADADLKPQVKERQQKYYVNPQPNWGPKPRATGK